MFADEELFGQYLTWTSEAIADMKALLKVDYSKLSERIDALEKPDPKKASLATTSATSETGDAVASLSESLDQRIGDLQTQLEEQVQKLELTSNQLVKQEDEISDSCTELAIRNVLFCSF